MQADNSHKLPGYTGHVPFRNDLVGLTTGEANKQSQESFNLTGGSRFNRTAAMMMSNTSPSPNKTQVTDFQKQEKALSYGNHSKFARSWIGGPQHEIKKSHIPGYTGFVGGILSENVFSQSYGRASAKSMQGKIKKGHDLSPDQRFRTQQQKAFSPKNFRRVVENPDIASRKDYFEYSKILNHEENYNKTQMLNTSMNRITANKTQFIDPSDTAISPPKTSKDLANAGIRNDEIHVKPRLLESRLAGNPEFHKLGEGFKRVFGQDTKDQTDLKLPVVGYTGHRKGDKAENMYGQNFRSASIQSKKVQRVGEQFKSNFQSP